MAVPSSIADLSTTAASNFPASADTVAINTGPDEYLRAHAAIIKEACATVYTATGTDTITFSTTPTFAAYAAGMQFKFIAAGANTGAVTLNVNSLGAKAITKEGTTALAAGDIASGAVVHVLYDGTRFQLIAGRSINGIFQPLDADLTAIAALANTDGNFIVGNGSAWVAESGATARTSLGLGTAAVVNTGVAEGDVPLIDYGTFTPAISFTTPGNLAVTYSNQIARYIKLGRLIIADIYLTTSAFTHTTASGDLEVTGLPVASENVSGTAGIGSIYWQGITKASYTDIAAVVTHNTSTCSFLASGSGQSTTTVKAADMPTGGNVVLRFTVSYLAAS